MENVERRGLEIPGVFLKIENCWKFGSGLCVCSSDHVSMVLSVNSRQATTSCSPFLVDAANSMQHLPSIARGASHVFNLSTLKTLQ